MQAELPFGNHLVTLYIKGSGLRLAIENGLSRLPATAGRFPQVSGMTIAFDPQYLLEMFRAVEGEPSVTLEMTDSQKPAVFRVGDNYLYLVMPMGG